MHCFRQTLPELSTETTKVICAGNSYRLTRKLTGIDPKSVHVFCTPDTIVVEIRNTASTVHASSLGTVLESQRERTFLEFRFPQQIEKGQTAARMVGDTLEISLKTLPRFDWDAHWLDMIACSVVARVVTR